VKNTQQTTKAMKMVSAAKLRRSQDAILNHRPYAVGMSSMIREVTSIAGESAVRSPLVRSREQLLESPPRKLLLVLVTSDRGLCGGFNSGIIKGAARWLKENSDRFESVELAFVGRKGFEFYRSRSWALGPTLGEFGGRASFMQAKGITKTLIDAYVEGRYDSVKFIFNEFKNAITQKVTVQDFLPFVLDGHSEGTDVHVAADRPDYIVRPMAASLLDALFEKTFAIQVYRLLLESQAGEHGARMSAMENATKNAGEMIRKLTLQYNKQRQAGITKELLEIISGSESQKSA